MTGDDVTKKKKKKRRNNKCKRLKSAVITTNERGLDIQSGLSQIEIHPYIPLVQRNIRDNSNYNTINNVKSTSVTSNILYDLLMKYNGFYNQQELEQLPEPELDSFKKHIEEAHQMANENFLLRTTFLQMELAIKESSNKYTQATYEKQEAQEELAVCEEVTRTLNREKLIAEQDYKTLKSRHEELREKLREMSNINSELK